MAKPADRDIVETLEEVEADIELLHDAFGDDGDDEGEIEHLSRVATVIRRLAREAGYELPVQ